MDRHPNSGSSRWASIAALVGYAFAASPALTGLFAHA